MNDTGNDVGNTLELWGLELWVAVSWLLAVFMFCSVLLSVSGKFQYVGRSKLRWFLLSLAAFIPYLGLIIGLAYLLMVRRHFPERYPPRIVRVSERPPTSRQVNPAPTRRSAARAPTAPPVWEPLKDLRCRSCGGSGYSGSCGCGNGWVTGYNGALEYCHRGCDYGKIRCNNCHGTGRV